MTTSTPEEIAEMRTLALEIKRLNPTLDIRYSGAVIARIHDGVVAMIAGRVLPSGKILAMFDMPLNLSVNGAKPEDYEIAA